MSNKNEMQGDIFNLSKDDMDLGAGDRKEKVLYTPKYSDGTAGVYKAAIRFIPNMQNPLKPILHKYVYWIDAPEVGLSQYVDSPQSIGEDCPINKKFWEFYKSDNGVKKKLAKEKLSRREQFFSLIQVVKDPHNTDLEGKIMLYKFPYTIKEMIDKEMSSSTDDTFKGVDESSETNVFDLFEGKTFMLEISKQGDWPTYKNSKFVSKPSGIIIDGEEMQRNKECMEKIRAYYESAPDITQYDYKPWDDTLKSKITAYLKSVGTSTSARDFMSKETSKASEVDDIPDLSSDVEEKSVSDETTKETPEVTAEETPEVTPEVTPDTEDASNDLESFLKTL